MSNTGEWLLARSLSPNPIPITPRTTIKVPIRPHPLLLPKTAGKLRSKLTKYIGTRASERNETKRNETKQVIAPPIPVSYTHLTLPTILRV